MFFIFIGIFAVILSTVGIYAYSATLDIFKWWQRILIGTGSALGFMAVLSLSRLAEPNFFVAVIYFFAWIIGGTILYSVLLLPLLLINNLVCQALKKPTWRTTGAWMLLTAAFTLSVFGIYQRTWIKITPYTISTNESALIGKHFAVVADPQFNIANNNQMARRITKQLEVLRPDAILMPGDIFDGATLKWEVLEEEFKKWSAIAPTFMAPGNHEEYGDYNTFLDLMRRNGIVTLEDQHIIWNGITIVGFKYYGREQEAHGTDIITKTFSEINPDQPIIVINHEPRYMELFASKGAELVLHGHTHGGQFWPLKYAVQQMYGKYWYGLNTVGDTAIITSSGLGLAAFPSRLFNTPEIVMVHFVAE